MIHNYKPKNCLPEYEVAKSHSDDEQAFAITINPENQFFGDVNRMEKVCARLRKQLAWEHLGYELSIEISQLGRIHFHGLIRIRKGMLLRFYVHMVPDLLGESNIHYRNTIHMRIMNSEENWANYCDKQGLPKLHKYYAPYGVVIRTDIHSYYE